MKKIKVRALNELLKKLGMVLLVTSLTVLTACSSTTTKEAANEDNDLKKVSIMLDWYPNAVHSFLYAGVDQGHFKDQGLELEMKMPAETNDPLKLVSTGEVDFALSYQPQVVMARAANIPVVSVAAVVRHPLNSLMVPKDSDIQSPKDLVGKTIGYPAIPMNEALVNTMVKTDGGDASQLKLIDVNWDLIPAIATNKVDAISGGFINHEQVLLEKEGHPMRSFNPVDFGVPDYYELVLVTSEKMAKEQPELVKQFWEASSKGFSYVKDHPTEALDQLLKQQDQSFPLEKDVEEKSLDILLPLMSSDSEVFGSQSKESWTSIIAWMKETQLIQADVEAEDCFITP